MTPAVSPQMLESARAGDPAALRALIEAAQPDVRRYARAACRNAIDAEDAAQDALLLIYRRVGTLRAVASFAGWAFAVVRRECRRLARLAFRRREQSEPEGMAGRPASHTDPELRMDLAAALQSLPDHYRAVLLLRDIEEMTIGEIGARLGLTREAAKARLHRGRALVREYLKD